MTTVTLTRAPQSFVPPNDAGGNRTTRLSHLDPRPLWLEPAAVESPWKSPGFWVACAIVLPLAAVVVPLRALIRLF